MRYERHLFICTNLRDPDAKRGSCARCGGEEVREKFKKELKARGLNGRFRANGAGCLDACEHGAVVVVYPDAVWYGPVKPEDVGRIIDEHLVGGKPVDDLRIQHPRYTPDALLKGDGTPSAENEPR